MRKERFTKEMQIDYEKYARIFKVMSDPKRLKIIDMLSEGELCACKILEDVHTANLITRYEADVRSGNRKGAQRRKMDAVFSGHRRNE